MKTKIKLLSTILFLSTLISFSQKKINASDIMEDIKDGKDISYNNSTIVGVLDFTFMDEALQNLPKKKKSWWNWGNNYSDNTVKKIIENKISFTNCTFTDDVLAYIPDENSGYTFVASFEEKVIFSKCIFERKAMFKYSKFEREADFTDANFEDDTTFKYAKFDQNISFSNTKFREPATFKNTKFRKKVSFENSIFEESATFKYTKFYNGVSFKNVAFNEDLNLKYTEVSGDFDITGMKVAYDIDSKYTKINGKSFNKYLLNNRN